MRNAIRTFRLSSLAVALLAFSGCQAKPAPAVAAAQPQAQARQAPRADVRGHLTQLLSAFCDFPQQEVFRSYGPEGYAALQQILADERELPSVRARAVTALMWSDPVRARVDLRSILANAAAPGAWRRSAAYALARLDGPQAVAEIAAVMHEPDRDMRESCAWALGSIPDEMARSVLRAQLAQETDAGVRTAIGKVLAK
jgi:hypothetical protein